MPLPSQAGRSLRAIARNYQRRRRRLPAVDEALALMALPVLLSLYLAPFMVRWGFFPMLIGSELLLIAGPALLFAAVGRYRWRETFAWRRPNAAQVTGALLIGVGVLP
jgi:hypothetical protein